MDTFTLQLIQVIVSAVGVVVTAVGFGFAVWQLHKEYGWRRQQYAVNMLAEWNEQTAPLRRGIDEMFTGLLDKHGPRQKVDLTAEKAHKIYDADQGTPEWQVKCHLLELLNYCEYVAVSFKRNVGDHAILEQSFQETLRRWHDELIAFIEVTIERRGYNPWKPFSEFVASLTPPGQAPNQPLQQTRPA
jgi:hypothetical protein